MEVITLKRGDACPACSGALAAARVPSAEQRRRAEDREHRDPLPADMDSATAQQRDELGELYRCAQCGYQTRFPFEHDPTAGVGGDDAGADAEQSPAGARRRRQRA